MSRMRHLDTIWFSKYGFPMGSPLLREDLLIIQLLGALPLAEGKGVRSTLLTWTPGHLDTRTLGWHLDTWTIGHWTLGNLGTWTLDTWTWTLGQLDNWTLGHLQEIKKIPQKSSEINVLQNGPEHLGRLAASMRSMEECEALSIIKLSKQLRSVTCASSPKSRNTKLNLS